MYPILPQPLLPSLLPISWPILSLPWPTRPRLVDQPARDILLFLSALVSAEASSEPFLALLVEPLLNLLGEKIKSVAVAAQAALDAIMTVLNPNAVKLVLPALLTSNDKWQANEARLNFIIALSKTAKVPLMHHHPRHCARHHE
jgi:hypothetical protein